MQFLLRQARLLSDTLIEVGLPICKATVLLAFSFLFLVAERRLDGLRLVAIAFATTTATAAAAAAALTGSVVAGLSSRRRRRRRRRRRSSFLGSPTDVQSNTIRHLNINNSADGNVDVLMVIVALAVVIIVPMHVMAVAG